MRKIIWALASILPLSLNVPAGMAYFWDTPSYLEKNTKSMSYSDLRVVDLGTTLLVFHIRRGGDTASIRFFRTRDLREIEDPTVLVDGMEVEEGFYPHFDVIRAGDGLYLAWNTLDGSIFLIRSYDQGNTWSDRQRVVRTDEYSFDPSLSVFGRNLVLFYHTESEGSRVDFYYSLSTDKGNSWSEGLRVAGGFSGSFFPRLLFHRARYYVVWQSRPFSEQRTPVFDVYLAFTDGLGKPWSEPVNLSDNELGEDERPVLLAEGDRLQLIWQSDRGGTRGIYYREFDLRGLPRGEPLRITPAFTGAREPRVLRVGGEIHVFYIDERTGTGSLYYAVRRGDGFEQERAVARIGAGVVNHLPLEREGMIYQFWHDMSGIAFAGPDRSAGQPRFRKPLGRYVGLRGLTVHWDPPEEASGIEGYLYDFNQNESHDPEILNLSSTTNSLKLLADTEGAWYLHIRARDKAGNTSPTLTMAFTADLTPPARPVLNPLSRDAEGYHESNDPLFTWKASDRDIVGFNYSLTRKKVNINSARLRTRRRKRQYHSLNEGTWYFQVAAIDRAGNVSRTARTAFNLRGLSLREEKPEVPKAPPWVVGSYRFQAHRFLNIALYILLGGLFFITFYITAGVIERFKTAREGASMDTPSEVKIRFGLRFKFSLLVGGLVLLLTLGISTVLTYVAINHERRALADQMIEQANLVLDNMTDVAREGILNNDELLLISLIGETMENEDIEYSAVLDTGNRVVAHSDINQRGTVFEDEYTIRASRHEGVLIEPAFNPDELAALYHLASPVMFADKRIGTVRVGYSTKKIFNTIEDVRRTSIINTIIITVVTIVIGIIGAVIMATITIKPIKVLANGANIIGGGNLEHKIQLRARDEIGMLAGEFNRMTGRLLIYQQEMEKKAKIDEQLDIARNIQQNMIPSTGVDTENLSINGFYRAAAGVGGDYYDFISIDKNVYGVIMSDVAGKGVPASLMMIMIRTVFKSLINSGMRNPAQVVTLMNSTLASDISSDRFATLLFGVLDLKKRVFRYTNAGYGPLMIYKADKKRCFQVKSPEGSIPIGVMPDVEYEEEKPLRLAGGDSIYLFTDGILEARNEAEEEYGMGRLSSYIPGIAGRGSEEIANAIVENVSSFVGSAEQFDDMTLMVMKVK
jgi:sigma-B regulation protein RsbU (phosphoserine phosphatase)